MLKSSQFKLDLNDWVKDAYQERKEVHKKKHEMTAKLSKQLAQMKLKVQDELRAKSTANQVYASINDSAGYK